jgi:hypothetical protein
MEGERLVDAAQCGDEVGFEGLDSLLGNIAMMIMGGDKLVRHVILLDCCLEFRGTLIVRHVMFGINSLLIEAVNETLICPYHFASRPVFNCSNEDAATVDVDKDHDILVTFA